MQSKLSDKKKKELFSLLEKYADYSEYPEKADIPLDYEQSSVPGIHPKAHKILWCYLQSSQAFHEKRPPV